MVDDSPIFIGIPELIDLALGSPEVGVVNFNILHALLHVMSREIFNFEQSRIELIQSSDGKFETILHKKMCDDAYNDNQNNDDNNINVKHIEMKKDLDTKLKPMLSSISLHKSSVVGDTISEEYFRRKAGMDCNEIGHEIISDKSTANVETDTKLVQTQSKQSNATKKENINDDDNNQNKNDINIKKKSLLSLKERTNDDNSEILGADDVLKREYGQLDLSSPLSSSREEFSQKSSESKSMLNKINLNNSKITLSINTNLSNENVFINKTNVDSSIITSNFATSQIDYDNIITNVNDDNDYDSSDSRKRAGMDMCTVLRELKKHEKEIEDLKLQLCKLEYSKTVTDPDGTLTNQIHNSIKEMKSLINDTEKFKIDIRDIVNKIFENSELERKFQEEINAGIDMKSITANKTNNEFADKFNDINQQILDLHKELCEIDKRINTTLVSNIKQSDVKSPSSTLLDLHKELQSIKTFIEKIMKQMIDFTRDNDMMKKLIADFQLSMNTLKVSKLDKHEIEELLSEKADYRMLQRKLSVESFDQNRRNLEKNFTDTIRRLSEQEQEFQSKIKLMNDEVNKKLDEKALQPLQQNIERKINAISEKLNATNLIKMEPEGSATKSRFLRNVNCIACDQNVMMSKYELERLPRHNPAHIIRSIKPELIYHLDNIKKENKKLSTSRNLKHFELINALGTRLTKNDKICNRFCGGSHTKITNQERLDKGIGKESEYSANVNRQTNVKCVCKTEKCQVCNPKSK